MGKGRGGAGNQGMHCSMTVDIGGGGMETAAMQNRGRHRKADSMNLSLILKAIYGKTEVTCLHSQAIGRR